MTIKDFADEQQDDIITRVRRLLDEGREDDAVELIQTVDDVEQIRIVSEIGDHTRYMLIYHLANAYHKSGILQSITLSTLDRVLDRARASVHGWSSAKLQKMIAEANGENPEAKEQSYPALKKINSLAEMGEKEYSKLPEDVREEMIEAAQLFLKNARKWNKKL